MRLGFIASGILDCLVEYVDVGVDRTWRRTFDVGVDEFDGSMKNFSLR